ncbi:hypothetical protein SCC4092_0207255 [Aggregatibacter actinomycetemcomitans serotype b str. SCC4092]|nr:hypothetical protein SCC1398_0202210 [Aggregatibacter actinomycetemcomitans serotype b str. SCC1398]KOE53588.1 hypothetical protein SCC4092_0207255 [Aggregatibacter actinomycetemcomitans serotype b str. SCC4092]
MRERETEIASGNFRQREGERYALPPRRFITYWGILIYILAKKPGKLLLMVKAVSSAALKLKIIRKKPVKVFLTH